MPAFLTCGGFFFLLVFINFEKRIFFVDVAKKKKKKENGKTLAFTLIQLSPSRESLILQKKSKKQNKKRQKLTVQMPHRTPADAGTNKKIMFPVKRLPLDWLFEG